MNTLSIIPWVSVFIISLYILSSCREWYEPVMNKKSSSSISTSNASPITKTIRYWTPSWTISTTFVFTIDETNTVKTIKATTVSRDQEDIQYANRFNTAAESKIVGKKISDLSAITIGGASLTTDAFKRAISSL